MFPGSQLTQSRPDSVAGTIWSRSQQTIALPQLHDRRRVHSSHLAQESCPLEQLHVFGRVKPVFAGGTVRTGETEALPGTNDGRGNADQSRHIADLQVRLWPGALHSPSFL